MDSPDDVSARVLLKNVLQTEPYRSPVHRRKMETECRSPETRSVSKARQQSPGIRRSLRQCRRDAGDMSPHETIRNKLKQKLHQSTSRSRVNKPAGMTSPLLLDGVTPRGLLKGIIQTEPESSMLVLDRQVRKEPNLASANSSKHSIRRSMRVSGMDLPDLSTENISVVVRGLSRKRPHRSFNVTAFANQVDCAGGFTAQDNEERATAPEELSSMSATSASSINLTLKTPCVDVKEKKGRLQRKMANRKPISLDSFNKAVQDCMETGKDPEINVEEAENVDFALGLSDFTAPDLLMSNTALFAQPVPMETCSISMQDRDAITASQLQKEVHEQRDEALKRVESKKDGGAAGSPGEEAKPFTLEEESEPLTREEEESEPPPQEEGSEPLTREEESEPLTREEESEPLTHEARFEPQTQEEKFEIEEYEKSVEQEGDPMNSQKTLTSPAPGLELVDMENADQRSYKRDLSEWNSGLTEGGDSLLIHRYDYPSLSTNGRNLQGGEESSSQGPGHKNGNMEMSIILHPKKDSSSRARPNSSSRGGEMEEEQELFMKTPAFIREKRNATNQMAKPSSQLATPSFQKVMKSRSPSLAAAIKPKVVCKKQVGGGRRSPAFPKSFVMDVFRHFAKTKVSADVYPVISEIMEKYFDRLTDDLEAFATHAKRKTIEVEDVELLMRRQGFLTNSMEVNVLIEKYLPLEYRKLLIPVATSGNRVIPKARK